MFNWIDYLLIGFFILGGVTGLMQGYLWQLYRLGCLILAYFAAWYFCKPVNILLLKFLKFEGEHFIGYSIVFFSTLVISFILGVIFFKLSGENEKTHKLIGAALGVAKNFLFACIIITYFWILSNNTQRDPINNSIIATSLRTATFSTVYKLPFDLIYTK